jgi:hypothetical protein
LIDGGKWDDQGTWHVSIEYIEAHFCADISLPHLLISFIMYTKIICLKPTCNLVFILQRGALYLLLILFLQIDETVDILIFSDQNVLYLLRVF